MKNYGFEGQIIFIYVQDLDVSKKFYEELLGLDLVLDQGGCRIVRTGRDAYLGFCSGKEKDRAGDNVLITLVTPLVDEWYQHLRENRVQLQDPPRYNAEYNIYHFFFQDPDGYKLEIQRFEDENWNSYLVES